MPFGRRAHHTHVTSTTTTAPRRRGLFTRRQPVVHHHQKRKASFGDKVSGALMKLRGSLTRRPGLKVCLDMTRIYTCIQFV